MNRHLTREDIKTAHTHRERCSTPLVIRVTQIKTTMNYHTQTPAWLKFFKLTIPSVDKVVELLQLSHTVGGSAIWHNLSENCQYQLKSNTCKSCDPAFPLLAVCPTECIYMFPKLQVHLQTAVFINVRNWKQTNGRMDTQIVINTGGINQEKRKRRRRRRREALV